MLTPMVRELKKAFPGSYVATLTQPHTANILLNNPYVDSIITDDLKKETFWNTVKKLRKEKFTHGLLLMPTERAAWQMFWAGIKTRVGVGHILYEVMTGMNSVSRNNYTPLRHEADYCMDLARKIGVVTDNITLEIFTTEQEKSEALSFLKKFGVEQNDFKLYLHTGNLGSSPNWSERKYLQLIDRILSEVDLSNLKLVLTAREMTDEFIAAAKEKGKGKVIDISKELASRSLRELIKVISVSDLFVCNSTGPLHIADALDRKCIGINCHRPMNSVQYWGIINKRSVNIEVSESFCDNHCSKDKEICCIEDGISVEEVLNAIKKLIKE